MATSALPQAPSRPGSSRGLIRVVSNDELIRAEEEARKAAAADDQAPEMDRLAQHIRTQMMDMRNFRNTQGIGERLINALRTYKGMYSPEKLQEIKRFNGSEVYARITSTKCRAATALLRDIYLGPDRPWDLEATPVPTVPDNIDEDIQRLVNVEIATLQQMGQQVDQQMIADRVEMLRKAADRAAKKQAHDEAKKAGDELDDILLEGGFYEALAEFLIDLPIFPFACIKGPVVRMDSQVKWVNGQPTRQQLPKMFWQRVSPFDLYWSPGASHIRHADILERTRLSRSELLAVKGLPGYKDEAIDEVIARFHDTGFHDWFDTIDTQRAELEDRERWARTGTSLIDCAEFTGHVSGHMLLDWGMDASKVPDPSAEYHVTAWLIDRFVIKAQINPTLHQRPPYYISSFEKVPGSISGDGLPDLLEDVQSICNATVRTLVNNMSISSGPQVIINDAVLAPGMEDSLYPWKRWHVDYDPMASSASQRPIDFFQPQSNSQELMAIYKEWSMMADDISAIPRYMLGNEKVGGAGRTASGLSMLMGAAAKTLQNVAAAIDRDVLSPLLSELYDMVMLTSPGLLRGDEFIAVKGVNYAVKREQDRMRQLEFLQLTANPIDMGIIGMEGRANILRSIAGQLGLEHERTVPDDEELQARAQMMQQMGGPEGGMPGMTHPSQQPAPEPDRAGPERVRQETGVEQQMTNQATGRPGMRAGG